MDVYFSHGNGLADRALEEMRKRGVLPSGDEVRVAYQACNAEMRQREATYSDPRNPIKLPTLSPPSDLNEWQRCLAFLTVRTQNPRLDTARIAIDGNALTMEQLGYLKPHLPERTGRFLNSPHLAQI